jgi:hypothetical protein
MYLTHSEISAVVQGKLNTIATSLYTATTITDKVVFKCAANLDEYHKLTEMEYTTGDNIRYTPLLLVSAGSTMQDDFTSGFYVEQFVVRIYAQGKDKQSIETIFDKYSYNENANDYEVLTGWAVRKNTGRLQFVRNHQDTSGDNIERIEYMISFTWEFILGGILSHDNATISIGGNIIDYLGISFSSDKMTIPNIAYGSGNVKPVGATGFTLSVTIPAQNITANKNLFADLASKTYNRTYAIIWTIPNFHTMTKTMVLKRGVLNYNRDQLISYTVTFEESLPRTQITINNATLPIMSFSLDRQNRHEAVSTDINVKNVPLDTTFIINARISYDSADTVSKQLLNSILTSTYHDSTYTIQMSVTGLTTVIYVVSLVSGKYAFDQTGELYYDCVFVPKEVNI